MNEDLKEAARLMMEEAAALTEALRLEALERLNILDEAPNELLDDIVRIAARIFDTKMATLTFIEDKLGFVKSAFGGFGGYMPREHTFCTVAIETPDEMMVIGDARLDGRFSENPYVSDGTICFYAGQPLVTKEGVALGALCVVDPEPRHEVSSADQETLRALSRLVMEIIEKRTTHG